MVLVLVSYELLTAHQDGDRAAGANGHELDLLLPRGFRIQHSADTPRQAVAILAGLSLALGSHVTADVAGSIDSC